MRNFRMRFYNLRLALFLLALPLAFFAMDAQAKAGKKIKAHQNRKSSKRTHAAGGDDRSFISNISNISNTSDSVNSEIITTAEKSSFQLMQDDNAENDQQHSSEILHPQLDLRRSIIADIPLLFHKEGVAKAPEGENSLSVKSLVQTFEATAYCIKNRTACGVMAQTGVVAADPRILPLGSIIRITAGKYTGTYRVLDTGPAIRGNRVDIYVSCRQEAITFGRRKIEIEVVRYGWGDENAQQAAASLSLGMGN